MNPLIQELTQEQLRTDIPAFRPGDTVRVHAKVVEGTRERIQLFEGVVIKRRGAGISETTVRKVSNGGVERTFPLHTRVAQIEVVRYGKVRRAKLYYLRALHGKSSSYQRNSSLIIYYQMKQKPLISRAFSLFGVMFYHFKVLELINCGKRVGCYSVFFLHG